jgi:hypothetical protein
MVDTRAPCQYPAGPYGTTVGSTISPTLTWQGYAPNSSSLSKVSITDFFDCDGSKGINALLLDASALWCGTCRAEASTIPTHLAAWGPDGIKFVTLIIEGLIVGQKGTTADALSWKTEYKLDDAWVVADPVYEFAHPGTNGLPTNILVDPRTMKIVKIVEGSIADPVALALQNKMK